MAINVTINNTPAIEGDGFSFETESVLRVDPVNESEIILFELQ